MLRPSVFHFFTHSLFHSFTFSLIHFFTDLLSLDVELLGMEGCVALDEDVLAD
jgi:hypothetical protein